jgi:hypothetical protein
MHGVNRPVPKLLPIYIKNLQHGLKQNRNGTLMRTRCTHIALALI